MSFPERLKMARLAKNLTQKELGNLIGVTGAAISNYEKSLSSPNETILIKLMHALGIDANYLFADDLIKLGPSFLSPEEERLITSYRALNLTGQQLLLTTAESYAANAALTEDGRRSDSTVTAG